MIRAKVNIALLSVIVGLGETVTNASEELGLLDSFRCRRSWLLKANLKNDFICYIILIATLLS